MEKPIRAPMPEADPENDQKLIHRQINRTSANLNSIPYFSELEISVWFKPTD